MMKAVFLTAAKKKAVIKTGQSFLMNKQEKTAR